mmetsp:Transcript_33673/g.88562  ORF Transcript_33673/g.88562 Transcript_33673/m.88562 type:complete len:211 (+) Transcript_33673:187-819(+)
MKITMPVPASSLMWARGPRATARPAWHAVQSSGPAHCRAPARASRDVERLCKRDELRADAAGQSEVQFAHLLLQMQHVRDDALPREEHRCVSALVGGEQPGVESGEEALEDSVKLLAGEEGLKDLMHMKHVLDNQLDRLRVLWPPLDLGRTELLRKRRDVPFAPLLEHRDELGEQLVLVRLEIGGGLVGALEQRALAVGHVRSQDGFPVR